MKIGGDKSGFRIGLRAAGDGSKIATQLVGVGDLVRFPQKPIDQDLPAIMGLAVAHSVSRGAEARGDDAQHLRHRDGERSESEAASAGEGRSRSG